MRSLRQLQPTDRNQSHSNVEAIQGGGMATRSPDLAKRICIDVVTYCCSTMVLCECVVVLLSLQTIEYKNDKALNTLKY